jgi:hypothetical protein
MNTPARNGRFARSAKNAQVTQISAIADSCTKLSV